MISEDDFGRVLDRLCPMHVGLDAAGRICRSGPTLQKLRPDMAFEGQQFLEVFQLKRPRNVTTMGALLSQADAKLHLQFRDTPQTGLKGALVRLPEGQGAIVNLSFGISILDAVRDYALTSADFSATDLAIELLYLVEAKSAAMDASRRANQRLQGAMIAAEEQAFTDTLTGLKNRRAMDHVLSRWMASGRLFALMHLDLDFFKAVNDTMGHAAGDHVLQEAARCMVAETRDADVVARIGGDEFVLIFDRLGDRARLDRIAGRLIARLQQPIAWNGQTCRISASIGIVVWDGAPDADPAALLHAGDLALYEAKAAGRGCHRFHDARPKDRSAIPSPPATRAADIKGTERG